MSLGSVEFELSREACQNKDASRIMTFRFSVEESAPERGVDSPAGTRDCNIDIVFPISCGQFFESYSRVEARTVPERKDGHIRTPREPIS